jgi:hypothetical protein
MSSLRVESHLASIAGCWSFWKWMRLRGAGFASRGVIPLAVPQAVTAFDELLEAERGVESAHVRAIVALEQSLDGQSGEGRARIIRALRKLRAGKVPVFEDSAAACSTAISDCARAHEKLAFQRAAYEEAYAREDARVIDVLRQLANDPRFREAVLWQNREAFVRTVKTVALSPGGTDDKSRARQQLVASYWQRYCVKNETIGFFGPQGLAIMDPEARTTEAVPGTTLLAKRTVYFEHWAIDALADQLSKDAELKLDLAPRRRPSIRVRGTTLHHPIDRQSEISEDLALVLAACDGVRSARSLARSLAAHLDEDETLEILAEAEEQRLITWTLEVPTSISRPEDYLRSALVRMESDAARRGLTALSELEQARERVAAAAGDPAALDEALSALDACFEKHTNRRAVRKAGQAYAGRTPVYEECMRALDLRLGQQVIEGFAKPLAGVLASARWTTYQIAKRYRDAFLEIYDRLVAETGSVIIDYLRFWEGVRHLFGHDGKEPRIIADTLEELQRRWMEILEVDPASRRSRRSAADLEPKWLEGFAAPHPGWPSARYHSPDVMIAAPSLDAVKTGRCTFVLGEIHAALNTCGLPTFQNQLDDPMPLIRAREQDLPGPMIAPVVAREIATNKDHVWQSQNAVDLEIGETRSWRPREQVLGVGSLVVERRNGELMVRDQDRTRSFHILEFLDTYLTAEISSRFELMPSLPHLPRISIDDLVICRERWTFPAHEVTFASVARGASQFAAARRWARDHGMPRWIFAKIPEEKKPIYVDFDSPLYVELLAKLTRRGSRLRISEMLPTSDDCWLPDAVGNTYSCELRMVAVDPVSWRTEDSQ